MKNDWIDVNRSLPEEGQVVICYNVSISLGFYQKDWCPYEKSKQGWNLYLADDPVLKEMVEDYPVTHWMSLPDPPN